MDEGVDCSTKEAVRACAQGVNTEPQTKRFDSFIRRRCLDGDCSQSAKCRPSKVSSRLASAVQQAVIDFEREPNMKSIALGSGINRRTLLSTLVLLSALSGTLLPASAQAQVTQGGLTDLLPSWNEGPAKQAISDFVRWTSDVSSPSYVFPEERIAVFDQDGTLWVEHPMYTQVMHCLERVPTVVAERPGLRNVEPFKTVLSGDQEAMAKLPSPWQAMK